MRIFSYITLFIILLLGITFASLNAETVTLNYYVGSKSMSLSLLLVIFLGVGVLLGLIVTIAPMLRLKNKNRRLKNQLKQLETGN